MKVRHSQLLPTAGCKAALGLGNKLKGVGDDVDDVGGDDVDDLGDDGLDDDHVDDHHHHVGPNHRLHSRWLDFGLKNMSCYQSSLE